MIISRRHRIMGLITGGLLVASMHPALAHSNATKPTNGGGGGGGSTSTSTTSTTTVTTSSGTVFYVAPGGTGDCSQGHPCGSVSTAFNKATDGSTIELAAGTYGGQTIGPRSATDSFTNNVVIQPASGASVTVAGFTVRAKHATIRGLTVENGDIYTDKSYLPDYLRVENDTVHNGTVYITASNHSAVTDTEIYGGVDKDGMNVKGSSDDVLIARNYIHDMRHDTATIHVDCLQLFMASNVTITDNRFVRCSRSALILETQSAAPTYNLRVTNNMLQHCTTADLPGCENTATSLWAKNNNGNASNFTIYNNMIDGLAFVDPIPGLNFQNNFLRGFFNTDSTKLVCGTSAESHNQVASKGSCGSLSSSDRVGWPISQVSDANDNPTPPAAGTVSFGNANVAPPADYYNHTRCSPIDVGAVEVSC